MAWEEKKAPDTIRRLVLSGGERSIASFVAFYLLYAGKDRKFQETTAAPSFLTSFYRQRGPKTTVFFLTEPFFSFLLPFIRPCCTSGLPAAFGRPARETRIPATLRLSS